MSLTRRFLNVSVGFIVLWLAWTMAQTFLSPIFILGLRAVIVLAIGAVICHAVGERVIRFVKGSTMFTPRIPHRKIGKVQPANGASDPEGDYWKK